MSLVASVSVSTQHRENDFVGSPSLVHEADDDQLREIHVLKKSLSEVSELLELREKQLLKSSQDEVQLHCKIEAISSNLEEAAKYLLEEQDKTSQLNNDVTKLRREVSTLQSELGRDKRILDGYVTSVGSDQSLLLDRLAEAECRLQQEIERRISLEKQTEGLKDMIRLSQETGKEGAGKTSPGTKEKESANASERKCNIQSLSDLKDLVAQATTSNRGLIEHIISICCESAERRENTRRRPRFFNFFRRRSTGTAVLHTIASLAHDVKVCMTDLQNAAEEIVREEQQD